MEKRNLGQLQVAPLAFGGNVFGWTVKEKDAFTLLDAFVSAGLNLIDTADVYSSWVPGNVGGESETIIGKWLKASGQRNNVVIATKLGSPMGEGKKGLSANYIMQAVEASLRRLQTDHIDLYQSHRDDESTPVEETLQAYDKLIQQGKVREIGASNFTAARLNESLQASKQNGFASYVSLQPHYNLAERQGYEQQLEKFCIDNHIGVIPYYSLASGFLSGKYRSAADLGKSPRGGGASQYLNERGFKILAALDQVSQELNGTPAQVSLAWLMARPGITAPIASATNLQQLDDLVKATQLKLSKQHIELLNTASTY